MYEVDVLIHYMYTKIWLRKVCSMDLQMSLVRLVRVATSPALSADMFTDSSVEFKRCNVTSAHTATCSFNVAFDEQSENVNVDYVFA